jgi:hypothetical protein
MGSTINLRRKNPEPAMSALGQKRTSSRSATYRWNCLSIMDSVGAPPGVCNAAAREKEDQ